MKRAAAIIGPTPSFVRWSIVHDCCYRQPVDQDIPHQTFRQLRSLRETSIGFIENRIVDGICIHGELNRCPDTARGFPIQEIEDIYGELASAETTCFACPANAVKARADSPVLAGCYGWFFSNSKSDLIESVEVAGNQCDSELSRWKEELGSATRLWFRIWQQTKWSASNADMLAELFETVIQQGASDHDLKNFVLALKKCSRGNLELVTELIPAGVSDGTSWSIEPHCSICRCEMTENDRMCCECGQRSPPVPARKRKVLGLRPYMRLKDIYGYDKTVEILKEFQLSQDDTSRGVTDQTT